MQFTKQSLEALKFQDLPVLYDWLSRTDDNKQLRFILENLGHLPSGFDGGVLLQFLTHPSDQIRLWAVKNLGKLKDDHYLPTLKPIAETDPDSFVRREAVSSIGRMRSRNAIPILTDILEDSDPKVVLQAIRGLLVFKSNSHVQDELKKLSSHPNETIHNLINSEFSSNGHRQISSMPHPQSPEFMHNTVVLGDVRDVLSHAPDEAIHLTFTSPPYYNARDYSIYESYEAYLEFLTDVFKAVHRITKEGRFLVVNTSPVIVPRVSRAHSSKRYPIPFDLHTRLVNMGWEFIDDIVWAKPEASVKNRNGGFLQHRKPLGYKPNPVTEYLMVYRKQTDKLIDWNMRQYSDAIVEQSKIAGEYETSNLWRIDPTFDRVHSAVFPMELCRRIITFYSYVGDLVFDPFGGSGTMGKTARSLERFFFMTEKEETYFERMKQDLYEAQMFQSQPTHFLNLQEFADKANLTP